MATTIATIERGFDALTPRIAALLPPDVPLDKFQAVVLAAIRQKPDLLRCDEQSLFNACLNAAQDGLMPDGREGAIVPRKGQAVWQPMIQGIYKRVKSSGSVATLSANVVYEGEVFEVILGDEDRIVHRRDLSKVTPGSEVAVYAIATLRDGTKEREVMTWEQVLVVRQASATPNAGPWVQWPDEMARKTVVRRLAKRLPVLDQADERLHSAINRVDSLYNFGTPAPEAPPLPPVVTPPPSTKHGTKKPLPKTPHSVAPPPGAPDADWRACLDWIAPALARLRTRAQVVEVAAGPTCSDIIGNGPDWARAELDQLLADNYARFPDELDEPSTADLPEVEIAGSDKMGAG